MDLFLDINGVSKHSKPKSEITGNKNDEWNEDNKGAGLTLKDEDLMYALGVYKNSLSKNSTYAGVGKSKKFGKKYYIEPSILAGLVTGYDDPVTPLLLTAISLGIEDIGKINFSYVPEYKENPSVWLMNLSIPIK